MIDSLNLNINKLKYLDYNHIFKIGARVVSNKDKDTFFKFYYNDIFFQYDTIHRYLLIEANAHTILGKRDITLSDMKKYQKKCMELIKIILPNGDLNITISRIDYCVDVYVGEKMSTYLNLLNRHRGQYYYMKKVDVYDTSLYIKTKYGQYHINFYDRYAKTGNIEDKGILRLELEMLPPKIRNEKKRNDVDKYIHKYWNKEAMEKYYFDFLLPYLFEGIYYKRTLSKKIIDKSDLSKTWKRKLNKFTLFEGRYGIDDIVKDKKRKKFCRTTEDNYIERLNDLGINPITIPKEAEYKELRNLYKLAREKAEADYFK